MPEAEEYRKKLIEKIAESDDAMLEKYLEGGHCTDEEIVKGVKEGALTKKVHSGNVRLCAQEYCRAPASG